MHMGYETGSGYGNSDWGIRPWTQSQAFLLYPNRGCTNILGVWQVKGTSALTQAHLAMQKGGERER